jgi:hypothetical protein
MPDSIASRFLKQLGVTLPEVAPVDPKQQELHDELARREMAKASPIKRAAASGIEGIGDMLKGFFDDPNMPREQFDKTSTGQRLGMAASVLPFGPKGVKGLYSRVEKIAETLPNQIQPAKLKAILGAGRTNPEELTWRDVPSLFEGPKVEQLTGGPNKPLAKQQIIHHLQENPLDVKVTRKGSYGDPRDPMGTDEPNPVQYDYYQMPGATNYREDLIQLADKNTKQWEDASKTARGPVGGDIADHLDP